MLSKIEHRIQHGSSLARDSWSVPGDHHANTNAGLPNRPRLSLTRNCSQVKKTLTPNPHAAMVSLVPGHFGNTDTLAACIAAVRPPKGPLPFDFNPIRGLN